MNSERDVTGEYHRLFPRIKEHPTTFFNYMRMNVATFDYIQTKIGNKMDKNWNNLHRQPMEKEQILVITIRFLCTGLSYSDLGHSFAISQWTIRGIIEEGLRNLWETLYPIHMQRPTSNTLKDAAQDFYLLWDAPHLVGAIDVCHIQVRNPAHSGSLYFNYNRYRSITLQAVVDANCRFTCIDVGGYVQHDATTTFLSSKLYRDFCSGKIQFPEVDELYNSDVHAPYFLVGDGEYPLSENLMIPYRGANLWPDQTLFNDRISRARLVVERSFDLLHQKWRIFHKPMEHDVSKAILIVQVACVLINTIIDLETLHKDFSEDSGHDEAIGVENEVVNVFQGNGQEVRDILTVFFQNNPIQN